MLLGTFAWQYKIGFISEECNLQQYKAGALHNIGSPFNAMAFQWEHKKDSIKHSPAICLLHIDRRDKWQV